MRLEFNNHLVIQGSAYLIVNLPRNNFLLLLVSSTSYLNICSDRIIDL